MTWGSWSTAGDDQYEITQRVADRLSALLAGGYRLPPEFVRPSPVRHLNYPLSLMVGQHALTSRVIAWTIATQARLGNVEQA